MVQNKKYIIFFLFFFLFSTTKAEIINSDTFTDAEDTDIETHTMDIGSGWTNEDGCSWQINATNQLKFCDSTDSILTTDTGISDGTITADLNQQDVLSTEGIVGRFVDIDNFWFLYYEPQANNLVLYKKIGGSYTNMDSTSPDPEISGGTDTCSLTFSGDNITGNCGGTGVSTTDADFNTATKFGFRSSSILGAPDNYFDNYTFDDNLDEPPIEATTTVTLSEGLGSLAFGQAVIIGLISLAMIAWIYNAMNKRKKPWQK